MMEGRLGDVWRRRVDATGRGILRLWTGGKYTGVVLPRSVNDISGLICVNMLQKLRITFSYLVVVNAETWNGKLVFVSALVVRKRIKSMPMNTFLE